jgi:hypothetical protein
MTEDIRIEDFDLLEDEALDRTATRAAATLIACGFCG